MKLLKKLRRQKMKNHLFQAQSHDLAAQCTSIVVNFEELKQMAKEYLLELPCLDEAGVENGMKAFSLGYLGCTFSDSELGNLNETSNAPALFRLVSKKYTERLIELAETV